jgi:transcriptional regulator with XRE-family HTH domain
LNKDDERTARLAGRLRDFRDAVSLSGMELAAHLGCTQSKITKIETGRTMPSDADVTRWLTVTGASQDELAEMLALLSEIRVAKQEWQVKFRRGQAVTQQEYDEMARNAKLVRNFETAAIPGLLQTVDYGRYRTLEGVRRQGADPDPAKVEESVAARAQRGQVLFDTSRRFEFLIAEPVLRWRLAPPPVLRSQFTRLITLSELPNVDLAILPFAADLEDTPQHGFILFDDLAVIETLSNEEKYPGDDKAEKYLDLFTYFMAHAATGDEARGLIAAATEALT